MAVLSKQEIHTFAIRVLMTSCRGSDGVAGTPESSTYRFMCNKLTIGQMYLVPKGWIHFLFFPCEDSELVFGFNVFDYDNVNVVNAFEKPFPKDKYVPGPGMTVEEMDDILAWVDQTQQGYVYGDSHLYMGSKEGAAAFCAKYWSANATNVTDSIISGSGANTETRTTQSPSTSGERGVLTIFSGLLSLFLFVMM